MQPNQEKPNYWRPQTEGEADMPGTASTLERPLPDVSDARGAEQEEVPAEIAPIRWQASEYIHHEKQALWFIGLVVVSLVLVLLSVFLMKSWSFTALVVVMAVAVGYLAMRPPRIMEYQLTAQGIQIDEKHFHYSDFRSFGIINEGPLYSVVLTPNKRFMPQVTMYFPRELGEQIIDMLGGMIPMEDIRLDTIDRLVRKLRF